MRTQRSSLAQFGVIAVVVLFVVRLGPFSSDTLAAEPEPKLDRGHAREMAKGLELFKSSVRKILTEKCVDCHGDGATEGGFSLADRDVMLKGGDSGVAVVPRNVNESRLYKLITHREEPVMPQESSKLSSVEIEAMRLWIELGAPFDAPLVESSIPKDWTKTEIPDSAREFWAYRPLADVHPPHLSEIADRANNDVDRFIIAKQQELGLRLNQPSEKRTLLRRAYLDLVGIPPTPEDVDAFVADESADAYERLIDRLLEDQQFGERWARHWLDVARFAESHGFEQDYDRPYAYHYRDFVIKAINSDLPYDTFVRWQLAGDEIAPNEPLALMATGFVGAGVFPTQITANEVERTRYDALDDMAATTSQAFLGLTVGCARCHDHKFDPIPQADYYRFTSTFTTTVRSNVDLPIYPDVDEGIVAAPKPVKAMIASEGVKPIRHHTQGADFFNETYFLRRGDSDQKQGVAEQGFLQVLSNAPEGAKHWQQDPPESWRTSYRRRALANWITDTQRGAGNLLARVIVNRLWHHHFGRGIVSTPNDFGSQGVPPTHPELLDWLANQLIAHNWQLKPIHRLIMTSAAYQQSSAVDPEVVIADPHNEWLTRFLPRRLEAEPLRDSMLAVSGRLDPKMYGPGSLDSNTRRRSIYFTIKRSQLVPTMTLFDVPEPNVSIGNRQSTTIAPQALHFLNSSEARACALALAERSLNESQEDPLRHAYRLTYGRDPTSAERHLVQIFLSGQTSSYRSDNLAEPEKLAFADVCQSLLASNEFVYLP